MLGVNLCVIIFRKVLDNCGFFGDTIHSHTYFEETLDLVWVYMHKSVNSEPSKFWKVANNLCATLLYVQYVNNKFE